MRDSYDWELECPTCGARGHARVSEDVFPGPGMLNFSVDHVSDGFSVLKPGHDAHTTVMICVGCNAIV